MQINLKSTCGATIRRIQKANHRQRDGVGFNFLIEDEHNILHECLSVCVSKGTKQMMDTAYFEQVKTSNGRFVQVVQT